MFSVGITFIGVRLEWMEGAAYSRNSMNSHMFGGDSGYWGGVCLEGGGAGAAEHARCRSREVSGR